MAVLGEMDIELGFWAGKSCKARMGVHELQERKRVGT